MERETRIQNERYRKRQRKGPTQSKRGIGGERQK